jgi:hypothetical protein
MTNDDENGGNFLDRFRETLERARRRLARVVT